jgi:hypothetical protein
MDALLIEMFNEPKNNATKKEPQYDSFPCEIFWQGHGLTMMRRAFFRETTFGIHMAEMI